MDLGLAALELAPWCPHPRALSVFARAAKTKHRAVGALNDTPGLCLVPQAGGVMSRVKQLAGLMPSEAGPL